MPKTDPAFDTFSSDCVIRVEKALDHNLPATTIEPRNLHEAMRYATFNGGKRVRPLLVYAAGTACGGDMDVLDIPACAVELIHSYSLVHDDLPAMDDDDLRRGKPTCHKVYDEATAILVGDALQSLAFELLARSTDRIPAETRLSMLRILANASGSRGMAGGQAMDIDGVDQELSLPELEIMHIHKTGALIRASVQLGVLSAGGSKEQLAKLEHYAKAIGLAFQVQDDILDITENTHTLGKTQGKDAADNKPTYPALLGLDGARQKARELLEEAHDALNGFDGSAQRLRQLADYVVGRKH
ncbi:MAG TPA: (2E,6E)-farnesyl diphosphate synthase [Thiolapillus brandeum]|uniref:(2E,6E)-farnesyl diphosphate synthase n=1 Tax=Thiolapillus brandeum TaxID=1076588 RepID=A0A831RXU8_9GAMM|nr:(2E,6E)-farnesyl diphosphate synthase [Thiolapillus brandeum]